MAATRQMYVSSRHDETVYKVAPNGTVSSYAEGMGVATGLNTEGAPSKLRLGGPVHA